MAHYANLIVFISTCKYEIHNIDKKHLFYHLDDADCFHVPASFHNSQYFNVVSDFTTVGG